MLRNNDFQRPFLLGLRPSLSCWRPSLSGWRPSLIRTIQCTPPGFGAAELAPELPFLRPKHQYTRHSQWLTRKQPIYYTVYTLFHPFPFLWCALAGARLGLWQDDPEGAMLEDRFLRTGGRTERPGRPFSAVPLRPRRSSLKHRSSRPGRASGQGCYRTLLLQSPGRSVRSPRGAQWIRQKLQRSTK